MRGNQMSVSGRELRESLNNGGASSDSNNLIMYGAIAGLILIAAIVFVVVGLMNTPEQPRFAEIENEQLAQFDVQSEMNTASFPEDLAKSTEVQKAYRSTLAKISMCGYGKHRKKFDEIRKAYEKRNAAALASWEPRRSKMYDKMMSGEASDVDVMLYATTGGMQKDVMTDIAQSMAVMDVQYERMSEPQCQKFSGDVRMKKFDIEPRPQG